MEIIIRLERAFCLIKKENFGFFCGWTASGGGKLGQGMDQAVRQRGQ